MKIGIFTNSYKPYISGVVNIIVLLQEGLTKLGHEVYVFAPKFPGYEAEEEENVFRFPSVLMTSEVLYPIPIPYSYKIFSQIPKLGLDIIFTHHPFLLGSVGSFFARQLNIPLVYTFHTQFEQYTHYIPFHQDLLKTMARFSVKNYADKCDHVICNSETILPILKGYGVKTPISLIPNFINVSRFEKVDPKPVRKRFNIKQKDRVFIYVGRIGKEKNLEFMVKAFSRVARKIPRTKLMIVGDGPETENLRKLGDDEGLGDRLILPGLVQYDEIAGFYGAGYSFIMTSTTETKPLVLMEAMATGLPCIAVHATGADDTIIPDYNGILTDNDMNQFSLALLRILEDKAYYKSLSRGAKISAQQYSVDRVVKEIEALFLRLIQEKKREKSGSRGILLTGKEKDRGRR